MKKIIFVIFILLIIIIISFNLIKQKELLVNFSVADLPDMREKEIVIKVLDDSNLSLENAQVFYEQLTQDFRYNVGEYWDQNATKIGTNTEGIYLDWWWGELEPKDDIYNWDYLKNTGIVNGEGEFLSEAEHVFIRLGVIATSAWIVGEGMDSFQDSGYPDWINQNDLNQVMDKYLEFVEALMNHLKFKPDFYMIEVEGNVLGINAGLTNTEVIDWHKRFISKIKEIDPSAKVSIVITSHELSPFMEEGRVGQEEAIKQDIYPIKVSEFLKRMNNSDYDLITVLIQPFGWMSKGNWEDARDFLNRLSSFRNVYIGWVGFLSEEPIVPDELNANPNGINQGDNWSFIYYPNLEGHSEEWQKEQTLNLMNYIISNPKIVGVHWDIIDYTEPGVGGQDFEMKLATGFTSGYIDTETNEVIQGEKRLVYEPMKELWQNLFFEGSLQTNEYGIAKFTGFSGKYKIVVSHPDYNTKEMIIVV